MRPRLAVLVVLLVAIVGGVAHAGVTAVPGGYEVVYDVDLRIGTSNGEDIQGVFIIEWDQSQQYRVDYPFTIAGRGRTRLSHVVGSRPTAALVIGYADGIPGVGDGKDHLFTLTNFTFAGEVAGVKWSDVFPGVPPHARVSHSAMIDLLRAAGAGDADARDSILDFIDSEGHRAAFDPAGAFRALEWTGATPIDDPPSIPTASGYGLVLMALAILLLAARRLGRG